jgi:hypothetical protein
MNDLIPVETSRADFFVTGNEYVRDGLDLKYIPRASSYEDDSQRGVTLTADNQNLQQSFLVAKNFFERTKPGTIKFVLIGLSPYIISMNDKEPPVVCAIDEKILDGYIKLCVDNGAKPVVVVLPVHPSLKKNYSSDVLKIFRDTINKVVKKYKATFVDFLAINFIDKRFQDNAHLNSNGSAMVSALLGVKLYLAKILSVENILNMNNEYFDVLSKYLSDDYKMLVHHIFCSMACDDFKRLSKILPKETCMDLMARVFSELTYDHLAKLSDMLSKDDYNDLAARIFKISAEKIRRKDKIKIGFFFENPSKWCGDELYNLFARDKRFEPTVFFFPIGDELTRKEFVISLEKFKSHGLNIFEIKRAGEDLPAQDVLIQISPYDNVPQSFRLINLKLTTLMAHFNYGISVTQRTGFYNWSFFRVLWRIFFSSLISMADCQKACKVGMPRGVYSGYPRMDIFFKRDTDFHFDWKMARPNAKKIIWAMHHTVLEHPYSLNYATFQWNYKFMYEFAKVHPEISWVVKPHPFLPSRAVSAKIFPSIEACKEYFQKWDDLPNAQVYMGAYYQAIFATSDGMIQDCSSFIGEYQYVNKPMIYLTRPEKLFNELGKKILEASYLVDGKDLDGIAALMQRIFIKGDDYKAAERKEVFDKYLNYPEYNDMLASEFIYKTIADELEEI